MSFQTQFIKFHTTIQLTDADENATLRQKRDAVLDRLRAGLKAAGRPTFTMFNQGSYATSTGIEPVKKDFDIDVGVVFTGARPDNPLEVKQWVYDAVFGHTQRVDWRRPCITVWYQSGGEPIYHVDLPIYWQDSMGRLALAVGKQHSGPDQRGWKDSDPKGLVEKVKGHLTGEDRLQFRRVVRYLKRWKDVQFPVEGNAAPVGIGLTMAALDRFRPVKPWNATTPAQYDDLGATLTLVSSMIGGFRSVWREGCLVERLEAKVPVSPFDDVFARMTDQQMLEFKGRLVKLKEQLEAAHRTNDSSYLIAAFGSDFPAS